MSNDVQGRATGAILANALFRWETAVTLAVTALLFLFFPQPFEFWQPWFWLVGGALAEIALVVSHLTDPDAAADAVAREFESKYDLRQIKSGESRQRLQRALEYRRSMERLIPQHSGAMKLSLQQTVSEVNDWIAHMYTLAQHIDEFESNALVERDRRAVPGDLQNARRRLKLAQDSNTDPGLTADLEQQVRLLEQQLTNLEATVNSVKRAEIQLESTLSSLGTVYAQMSLLGTKEVDSARTQRLRQEIQDEVAGLQDTLTALDEVQSQRLQLR